MILNSEHYLFIYLDVSDLKILQNIADSADYKINVSSFIEDKEHQARQKLLDNTLEAVQRGAFGVPRYKLCISKFFFSKSCFVFDYFLLLINLMFNIFVHTIMALLFIF